MKYLDQEKCIFKYPDGSTYAKIDEDVYLNEFTFRVNSYNDLMALIQVIDVCNHKKIRPVVTIPCLIDAQADRRFSSAESHGLKIVGKILNGLNADFRIFHPHNPEVVEALMDNVSIIDNSMFLSDTLEILGEQHNLAMEDLVIMSPDAGAYKWLNKACTDIGWKGTILNAAKVRVGGEVKGQQLPLDDFKGRPVLIVDDLCIYGGTFKGLATLLREANCGKVYLAVSHITIQNHICKKRSDRTVFDYFDQIFTTNSKFKSYSLWRGEGGWSPTNLTLFNYFNTKQIW